MKETKKQVLGHNLRLENELKGEAKAAVTLLNLRVKPAISKLGFEPTKENLLLYMDENKLINDYTKRECKGIDAFPKAIRTAAIEAVARDIDGAIKKPWGTHTISEPIKGLLLYDEKACNFGIDTNALKAFCTRYVEPHQEQTYKNLVSLVEALNTYTLGRCGDAFLQDLESPIYCYAGEWHLNGDTINLDDFKI